MIELKRVTILDFIISGCILYTKGSRMVIFGLVFLVYILKLSMENGFWNTDNLYYLFKDNGKAFATSHLAQQASVSDFYQFFDPDHLCLSLYIYK